MDLNFFQKLAIIEQLLGDDAPITSKLRAYLGMHDPRPVDLMQAVELAMHAIRLDAYGFGWHTEIEQFVEGEGSPSLTFSVGEIIDRYNLSYFLSDTEDNGRLLSDEWFTLINTTK